MPVAEVSIAYRKPNRDGAAHLFVAKRCEASRCAAHANFVFLFLFLVLSFLCFFSPSFPSFLFLSLFPHSHSLCFFLFLSFFPFPFHFSSFPHPVKKRRTARPNEDLPRGRTLRSAPQPGTARKGPQRPVTACSGSERRREHDSPTSTPGVTKCCACQQKRTRLLRTPALATQKKRSSYLHRYY